MMSINGGLQLLQLSSNRYWPLGQLHEPQHVTVTLSVCRSQNQSQSLTHNTT